MAGAAGCCCGCCDCGSGCAAGAACCWRVGVAGWGVPARRPPLLPPLLPPPPPRDWGGVTGLSAGLLLLGLPPGEEAMLWGVRGELELEEWERPRFRLRWAPERARLRDINQSKARGLAWLGWAGLKGERRGGSRETRAGVPCLLCGRVLRFRQRGQCHPLPVFGCVLCICGWGEKD